MLLQKARDAYQRAQRLESTLNQKPSPDRSRSDYLKVINTYQEVYLITPHTPYADDALIAIAKLYEQIDDTKAALKTLKFLIHDYPQTPFLAAAEKDAARLEGGVPEKKPAANTANTPTGAVENIRFWETGNSVRVVVDLSAGVALKQGEAKSPHRVFLDLTPARIGSGLPAKTMQVKSALLEQIRVGQFDLSTVRVVLDVASGGRVTSFTLHDPDRLIIDVADVTAEGTSASAASARTAPKSTGPRTPATIAAKNSSPGPAGAATADAASKAPAPAADTAAAAAPLPVKGPVTTAKTTDARADTKPPADSGKITPAKPANNGDRSLVRSLGLKIHRVVIDAGHGGHDTGTIGPTGYTEKELVLDVAKRLKDLIETQLNAEVVMTRDEDTFIPLESRTAIANKSAADLFISIHANSSSASSVRGVETFFLNLTNSRSALETANRENAASESSIHELQDLIKKIMLRDKVDESRELATYLQKSMSSRKDSGTDRGVKQAPFVVLIGANMPSVLAEVSFISNPQEEKQLRTPEYRQRIAESLFEGVRSYSESLSGTKTARGPENNRE